MYTQRLGQIIKFIRNNNNSKMRQIFCDVNCIATEFVLLGVYFFNEILKKIHIAIMENKSVTLLGLDWKIQWRLTNIFLCLVVQGFQNQHTENKYLFCFTNTAERYLVTWDAF